MIGRSFRDAVNLLLYSGAFIGLCAACVTSLSFELCGRAESNLSYSALVGAATAALYGIHRIIGLNKVSESVASERFVWIRQFQFHIRVCSVFWTMLTLWISLSFFDSEFLLYLLPGGIIAVAYVAPFLPGGKRLRDLGWGKIIMIGWSWGWLTAFIPLWHFADSSIQMASIHGIERMMFVMLMAIPFDIRDVQVDKIDGLVTLPQKLSIKKIKRLTIFLGTLVVLFSFLASFHYLNPSYSIAVALVSLLFLPLIQYSYKTNDDYFFSGLIDGILILLLYTYIVLQVFI